VIPRGTDSTLALRRELFQPRDLRLIGSDDQLAAAPVRDPTLGEERVEREPAATHNFALSESGE